MKKEPLTDEQRKQRQKDLISVYKHVFSTGEGKKILEDLRDKCYYDKRIYDDNPNVMYFKEGRRELYLYILDILKED